MSGVEAPGRLWGCQPFAFQPSPFEVGPPVFAQRAFSSAPQVASLRSFMADPSDPHLYAVSSNPDDLQACYFAAWLLHYYIHNVQNSRPLWVELHKARQIDPIKNDIQASFVVISGAYPSMTPYRVELLRDLVHHYDTIPRIVVGTGEDPLNMMQRMNLHPTSAFYKASTFTPRSSDII